MGKHICYIILLTILFILPLQAANRESQHLSTLEYLMDNYLAFDTNTPIDSVIYWGEQITPTLEKEGKTDLFFRIKQQLVQLYSYRGDIGQAIDEARLMYEKAKTMNYQQGMALASRAIGDAYHCSNMAQEAIDSYKEAIQYHITSPDHNLFKEATTLKLISLLMMTDQTDEAGQYIHQLEASEYKYAGTTLHFFDYILHSAFYIKKENIQKAAEYLQKAEHFYTSNPQPYFYPFLNFACGQYNETIGAYEQALQNYDEFLENIHQKNKSVNYLHVSYTKANLLIKMGKKLEAARLYERISEVSDSVVSPSYSHRINNLRARFEENRMQIENKEELNHLLLVGLVSGVIILGIITYLAISILKQNKKLEQSKIKLEQSRLNAENAMHTKSLSLSNMSHEIRTPLSAISGFSELLTDKQLDEETRRQCSEVIQRNSDLLIKLINDVIDLSNLGTGNIHFHFNYHDAISICRDVINTVNNVKKTEAEVLFKSGLESLQLYTDDSRLQQLLINLLINATKFTPKGSITLEVEQYSKDSVLFTITDTGCGIPPEKQSKIFNRFEKLNETAQGSGLGLSICQLIIEHIGGNIWLDSSYTGGCRFCFTHPINPIDKKKETEGEKP